MAATPEEVDPVKFITVKTDVVTDEDATDSRKITTIMADPMWPEEEHLGQKEFEIFKGDLKFKPRPKYIGDSVFLDCEDTAFYSQTLKNPCLRIWLLSRVDTLDSGRSYVKKRLIEEARRQNIDMQVVSPKKVDLALTRTVNRSVLYTGRQLVLPDVILVRVGAMVDYFGIAVMRQLTRLGVVMVNGPESIEISKDKMYTLQVLSEVGIPIPKTMLLKPPVDSAMVGKIIGDYPIIIKQISGSQGEAVWKADSQEECDALVKTLSENPDECGALIFQEFLAATKGRDLRVLTIGDSCVAGMMRVAAKGSYKANVHQGGAVYPIEIGSALSDLCLATARLCKLDIAGVDLMMDGDSYKICEVNSSPGFEGLEHATKIDVAKMTIDYCKKKYDESPDDDEGAHTRAKIKVCPVQEDHWAMGLEQKEDQRS